MSTDKKRLVYHDKYMTAQVSYYKNINYGTAFLGLVLSIVQIVLLVILSRVLLTDCITSSSADKNLWLVFQDKREAIELAMGVVLL